MNTSKVSRKQNNQMIRLPQLHWVNNTVEFEHYNCEPDDVVLVNGLNLMYRFGDERGAKYGRVTVSRQRSDKYDAPIDGFIVFIRSLAPRHLTISVDPQNRSVRRRFSWINPAWYEVTLIVYFDQQTEKICLQDADVVINKPSAYHGSCKYTTGDKGVPVAIDDSRLTNMLNVIKQKESVVRGSLYGYRSDGSTWPLPSKEHLDMQRYEEGVHYNGVSYRVFVLYGQYAPIKKAEVYLRSSGCHVVVLPPDTLPANTVFLDVVRNLSIPTIWHPTSLLRWPRHRATLFDVALVLGRYLPPYVLLEIVDWLPLIEDQVRFKKVELLEGVCGSMRRMNKLTW